MAADTNLLTACILVFDLETTGTSVTDDRVVELGAAYFQAGRRLRLHRMLVNPGMPIPPAATAVHGIGDADVANEPGFAAVGARFAQHLSGAVFDGTPPVLSGYNAAAYDAPLLNAEFARYGLDTRIDAARVVDPFVFMKWHHRALRGRKLTEACEHYGLTLNNAHTAAADARAAGELLWAMIEAGLVPVDLEACLSEQGRINAICDAEFAEWRTWLYRDRETGELRMGAGKHAGRKPSEIDPGYFQFVLDKMEDLPPAVRKEFGRYA